MVSVTQAEVTKPPKKRRKKQAGSDDERMDVDRPPSMEQGLHLVKEQEEVTPLRSFPLPNQPEPPSKSVLARQALGQSLANAEIVQPTTTLSLQEENHVTRQLSPRMRKLLGELGITKLFASKPGCTSHLGYSLASIIQFRRLSSHSSSPIRARDQIFIGLMILRVMSLQVPLQGVAKH